MASDIQIAPVSTKLLWTGRVISGLAVMMLLFSGVVKFTNSASLAETFTHLGYDTNLLSAWACSN
jgi:hypothetical protein